MPNLNFGIFVILVSGVFATSAVVNKIKSTPANIDQVKQLVQAEATLHQAILLQGDKQGDLFVDKDKAELWIKNFRESIHKQSDVVYLDTYLDLAEKFNNLNIGVSGTLKWLRDNSIDEYREQVEMNLANQSIQQNQSPVAIDDAKVDEFSQKLDEVLN